MNFKEKIFEMYKKRIESGAAPAKARHFSFCDFSDMDPEIFAENIRQLKFQEYINIKLKKDCFTLSQLAVDEIEQNSTSNT